MRRRYIKGALAALAVVLTLGLAGCDDEEPAKGPAHARTGYVDDGAKVYFSFKDPKYDDRGPGSYTYPLVIEKAPGRRTPQVVDGVTEDLGNTVFNLDTRTGFFDMTDFKVIDGGPNVVFEITTARPIPTFRDDQSSEAKGWFLQLMDIYIDKDHKPGSGLTRTLPGRNIEFAPECAWEQCILVTPQVSFDVRRQIEQLTQDLDLVHNKRKIFIPDRVFIEGYTFRVFVPKSEIGEPQPGWGYQCCMMLFNPSNTEYGHFQEGQVKRFAGNNYFGGADEFAGHPNVIDILAPTPEDQYRWLSDFVSSANTSDNRYAIVPMIYGEAPAARPAKPYAAKSAKKQQTVIASRQPPPLRQPASRREPAARNALAERMRAGGFNDEAYAAAPPAPRQVARARPAARRPASIAPPAIDDDGGGLLAAPRPVGMPEEAAGGSDSAVQDGRNLGVDGGPPAARPALRAGSGQPAPRARAPRRTSPADIDAAGDDLFSNTGGDPEPPRQRPVRRRNQSLADFGDGD